MAKHRAPRRSSSHNTTTALRLLDKYARAGDERAAKVSIEIEEWLQEGQHVRLKICYPTSVPGDWDVYDKKSDALSTARAWLKSDDLWLASRVDEVIERTRPVDSPVHDIEIYRRTIFGGVAHFDERQVRHIMTSTDEAEILRMQEGMDL